MGPKLLLSDRSTADQPVLRWRLRVRGNTAVEFGCVPADLPVRAAAQRAWAGVGRLAWRTGTASMCMHCAKSAAPASLPPDSALSRTGPHSAHYPPQPTPTALHKCMSAPGCADHRAAGFCSQITAGSLLPLKAPVMRGTLVDLVARRGHIEVRGGIEGRTRVGRASRVRVAGRRARRA